MNKLLYSKFFPGRPKCQARRWYLWICLQEIPRVAKAKWQRSRRGWADCDVWSIDSWFQHVVPDMLRQLAANKQGTPLIMFSKKEIERMDAGVSLSAEEDEAASERWQTVLHTMANRIEASDKFWNELDKYENLDIKAFSEKAMEAELEVTVGLTTFVKYFYALWD